MRWASVVLLAAGAGALLLSGTVFAVPLALLYPDPRMVGTVLVGFGLIGVVVEIGRRAGDRQTPVGKLPVVLAGVAIGVLTWVHVMSYDLETVAFENDSASLRGTLVLPRAEGPHPAVVFMHGSGPERRAVSFHFADRFAQAGVASLIYDKRGTGESVGGNPRDPYPELAADAMAAVDLLRHHPSIDPDRIGLWGASEGGWTAPLAASMNPDSIAFLVVVSGGGAAYEDEQLYSIRTHLEERGVDSAGIDQALDLRRRINDYYRSGVGREELLASIGLAPLCGRIPRRDGCLGRRTNAPLASAFRWPAQPYPSA